MDAIDATFLGERKLWVDGESNDLSFRELAELHDVDSKDIDQCEKANNYFKLAMHCLDMMVECESYFKKAKRATKVGLDPKIKDRDEAIGTQLNDEFVSYLKGMESSLTKLRAGWSATNIADFDALINDPKRWGEVTAENDSYWQEYLYAYSMLPQAEIGLILDRIQRVYSEAQTNGFDGILDYGTNALQQLIAVRDTPDRGTKPDPNDPDYPTTPAHQWFVGFVTSFMIVVKIVCYLFIVCFFIRRVREIRPEIRSIVYCVPDASELG